MPQNYQPDRLGQALDKIKINYEQRIYEHSHDGEKHFTEIFRYLVENVLWKALTQRKEELEQKKYIVNITRHFPDCSNPACFVKMELSPAPAFCTGDAPNEAKNRPVYEWVARPNARAGLVEILHYSHAVHRPSGACRVLRTLREWWYTDRISADQLTIKYVESSVDKWAISSIRHYVRKPKGVFWRKIYYGFIYDSTAIIMVLSLLLAIACNFLPSFYALLSIISITIGVFVGAIFYVRSFWENHIARVLWVFFSFFSSIAIIPVSRQYAGIAIERKTALSAESFSAAWDIISLLYTIPAILAIASICSILAYSLVAFFSVIGKIKNRIISLLLFLLLTIIFTRLMVPYTEKRLLLFLDDIIAFTFVRNCQETSAGSAQNCICEGLPESTYIHFYEGNNVVDAKLRTEVPHSNKDLTSKYDFNYVGDGKSLKCVGVSRLAFQ